MYEIKPTFDRSEIQIDLPICMYKMKTINEFGGIEVQHLTNGSNGNVSAAVSLLTNKSLPDVSLQIEKFLKVLLLLLLCFACIQYSLHPIQSHIAVIPSCA